MSEEDDFSNTDYGENEASTSFSRNGSHLVSSSSNHHLIDRIIDRMKNELREEFSNGSPFCKERVKGRNIAIYIHSNDEEDLDEACRELGCNRSQFIRVATRIACMIILDIPEAKPQPAQVHNKEAKTRELTENERHIQQLAEEWPTLEIDSKRKQVRYAMKRGFYDQLKQTVTIDVTVEQEVREELAQEAKATTEASPPRKLC
jgi:AraC-like DNA-binding protein